MHPSIVDFAERALATTDVRIYQAQATAKYTGLTNYEQPMHTDRNHSWLPAFAGPPWYHVEGFLFLSDVDDGTAPTHLVPCGDAAGHEPTLPIGLPKRDPELFAAERAAAGISGSFLAYRTDVFHRAVDLTTPGGVAVPAERQLQGRRRRLDRVPLVAVEGDVTRLDRVRRRLDATRARALRLPPTRRPDLDAGAPRHDRRPVPEPRPRPLARRPSRSKTVR